MAKTKRTMVTRWYCFTHCVSVHITRMTSLANLWNHIHVCFARISFDRFFKFTKFIVSHWPSIAIF